MKKYRKKPVVIEALRWDGTEERWAEMMEFAQGAIIGRHGQRELSLQTLEGRMTAAAGDWIIKGVKGELYPCKPDIFEATYEPVDEEALAAHEAARRGEARGK